MSPPVLHLPLDLTGNAVTNKVTAELHLIAATGTRAFVTRRGPFFTRGMVLRNHANGAELVPNVDYRPVHLFIEASLRTCDEICSVVIILPTSSVTEVEVDYQAIGGEYSTSVTAIEQMLESLDLDNRTVYWGDIIGSPEYFPPTPHPHDIGDVYGFEYLVAVLEQIRRAILLGDQASFDELRQYIDAQDNSLRNIITALDASIDEHISNTNNPHNTTKAQVGLGNVDNFATADQAAAEAGLVNNLFMTPLRTAQAIAAAVGDTMNAHIGNTNNPHNTTKAHVGLGNVQNFGIATTFEAVGGEASDKYMTPATTSAAINTNAVAPLNLHLSRVDNPHATTKAQVGLGNVDNYATADLVAAAAGTATNLFMTPAGTRAFIDAYAGDLTDHIARTDNPHNTTKAQVGLGNVQDYPMATQAQAEAGGTTEAYMSPGTTSNAISQLALIPLSNHISNTANPHGTTATQVGLGNVGNFGVSSQGDAETGTANNFYMTPLRSKQAITFQAVTPLTTLINQRVVTNSNGTLNSLQINTQGYLFQDVDGSTTVRVANTKFFQFQVGGDFVVSNGKVIASGGFQPSDRRLKENIVSATARALWRNLSWKEWDMIESGEHQKGLIAQHLQKVAPDRVTDYAHGTGRRKSKRLAIDNTGVALEMAFAAGVELDALQVRVDGQSKLIAQLTERLSKLEQRS
jgi:hypothetical protein